ncbi:MAG: hypothetical protein QM726_00495 [Chitinophagaceae bacterium]
MHLLYITFGKDISNHIQAAFSICSFLTQEPAIDSINIITDEPSFYKKLSDKLNVIETNHQQLEEWKGPHQFFWRIKIKAIAAICARYPNEPVVYLDTDTFLYSSAKQINEALYKGQALMHENEGPLSKAGSKTEKKMWAQVKNKNFGGTTIVETDAMWNAGVVATPNTKDQADIQMALQICDDMCAAGVTLRLIEQFALAVALQRMYGLIPADNNIAHYWSNKEEWNVTISRFFMQCWLQKLSLAETIELLQQMDLSITPVVKQTTNTNKRLQSRIDKIFPARNIKYVSNQLLSS